VIDDDEIYQFTIRKAIESTNLVEKTLFFTNGEQAYRFFEANAGNKASLPEVVLLDINMPVLDGWGFIQKYTTHLKTRLSKKMAIYMVSSSVDQRDLSKAKSDPDIKDYIVKPITSDQLKKIFQQGA
jgi:CheY-like chemotaxis protein